MTPFCNLFIERPSYVIALMRRPSPAINKRRRATHQWILFMTGSDDVTPKTTEQNLIARIGKTEDDVTNNSRLLSKYLRTVESNYWQTRNIAQLLCDSRASCCVVLCRSLGAACSNFCRVVSAGLEWTDHIAVVSELDMGQFCYSNPTQYTSWLTQSHWTNPRWPCILIHIQCNPLYPQWQGWKIAWYFRKYQNRKYIKISWYFLYFRYFWYFWYFPENENFE